MMNKKIVLLLSVVWLLFGFSCYYPKPLVLTANYLCDKNDSEIDKKNIEFIEPSNSDPENVCKNLASRGLAVGDEKKGYERYGYIKNTKKCVSIMFKSNAHDRDHTDLLPFHIENFKKNSIELGITLDENTISVKKFNNRNEMDNWCATNIP